MTHQPLHPPAPQQQHHHSGFHPPCHQLRRPQHDYSSQQGESSTLSNGSSQSDHTKETASQSPGLYTHMSSKPSSSFPTKRLSSQGSSGTVSSKISKRRPRVTNKTPITVLSADTSNFRAMVQKLTGIPSAPPLERGDFHFFSSSAASAMPSLGPHLTRAPPMHGSCFHSLPTAVDTAFFLPQHTSPFKGGYGEICSQAVWNNHSSGSSSSNMHGGAELGKTPPYAALYPHSAHPQPHNNTLTCASPSQLLGLRDPANGLKLKCREASAYAGKTCAPAADPCMYVEADGSNIKESVESIRSSEDYHPVDLWLSFDAGHAPKMETAPLA